MTQDDIPPIRVEIEHVDSKNLYLLQTQVQGNIEEEEFTVGSIIPGGSLVMRIGGEQYVLNVNDMIEAVLTARGTPPNQNLKENKAPG